MVDVQVDFDFRDDAVREDIPMFNYVRFSLKHRVDFLGKIRLMMLIILINTREV